MAEPSAATTRDSGPQPTPWRDLVRLLTFLLVVGLGLIFWVISGAREDRASVKATAKASGTSSLAEPFIGRLVCRECHPAEHAAHSLSGHNQTLRAAGSWPLARYFKGQRISDPEKSGITWTYEIQDGRLSITRFTGEKLDSLYPIDYAVGSGKHATTFVTIARGEPSGALEHRLTYFAHSRSLALTPGQLEFSKSGQSPYGFILTPRQIQDCINCHSTRTAAERPGDLDMATMIPNVSCERCHGPGRSHVQKARVKAQLAEDAGHAAWSGL